MKKFLLVAVAIIAAFTAFAGEVLTIKFTGENVNTKSYVQLDSVIVTNLSHPWEQTIFYPDTVLQLATVSQNVGIEDVSDIEFGITDLRPNPFNGVTQFNLAMPQAGTVNLLVSDLSGRNIIKITEKLPAGVFTYELSLQQSVKPHATRTRGH